jgi:hypothetical protein
VITRSVSDEAIHSSLRRDGLLRCARNDETWDAADRRQIGIFMISS